MHSCANSRKDLGTLQTNVEYLTDRIINNNATSNNTNYSAINNDQNLGAISSSNDFDISEAQIANQESALEHNEGTFNQIKI